MKRNLSRLIDLGELHLAMELSLELMKQGSYQVEMSDEGLMTDDIEECLRVVLPAVKKCGLPPDEVVAWCAGMTQERPRRIHLRSGTWGPAQPLPGLTAAITRRPVQKIARRRPPASLGARRPTGPTIADHARPASQGFSRLPEGHEHLAAERTTVLFHQFHLAVDGEHFLDKRPAEMQQPHGESAFVLCAEGRSCLVQELP